MTNYMVKSGSGTGCGWICFRNPAKSGSGRISQKQIRYSPNTLCMLLLQELMSRQSSVCWDVVVINNDNSWRSPSRLCLDV